MISRSARRRLAAALAALGPFTAFAQTSGFTDVFAPANWTFISGGEPASVTWDATFSSFTLTGSDDGSNTASDTLFTVNLASAYRVSFDWSYSTADFPSFDFAGYTSGTFTQLSDNSAGQIQSGSTASPVYLGVGDSGFYVRSFDNTYGAASLTISNFSFTLAAPGDTGDVGGGGDDGGGGSPFALVVEDGDTVLLSATSETATALVVQTDATLNLRQGATLALSDTDSASAYLDTGGHLSLSGAGTALSSPGGMLLGSTAAATVEVLDGAKLTLGGSLDFGGSDGDGRVTVSGPGSRLEVGGVLQLGAYGYGSLSILDGAAATAASAIVGDTGSGRGDLLVSGASSSLVLTGDLTVGTNPLRSTFTVTDGASATIGGTFSVFGLGEAYIGTGGLAGRLDAFIVSVNGKLHFNHADDLVFSAPLSLLGGTLTKSGPGTLILTGAMSNNTTDNTLLLNGGTLQIGNAGTTGTLDDNVVSASGTALVFKRSNAAAYGFVYSGAGSLTQAGSGTLTLSGANTHTGGTTVSAGTLRATTTASALGAGSLALAGGNLALANNTGLNFARPTTVSAAATITSDRRTTNGAGVTHTLGALSIGSHTLSVAAGSRVTSGTAGLVFGSTTLTGNPTFSVGANTRLTLGAVGQSGGARGFTKTGPGTLVLSSAGTYTGGTTLDAGTLRAGHVNAFGSGPVRVNGGLLDLGGFAIANTLDVRGGSLTGLANYTGAQTLSGPVSYTGTVGGNLTLSSGAVLDTTGATFTGTTTIQSGATLSGTGTLASVVIASGGTLAPGNSPGLLAINGDLTLASGSFTTLEIAGLARGTGYDAIDISGAFTAGGTLSVSFSGGYTPSGPATFDFFNFTSFGGSFAQVNLPVVGGYTWNTSQLSIDGTVSLVASAIPEPSSFAALAGLAGLAFSFRRRRRRNRAEQDGLNQALSSNTTGAWNVTGQAPCGRLDVPYGNKRNFVTLCGAAV